MSGLFYDSSKDLGPSWPVAPAKGSSPGTNQSTFSLSRKNCLRVVDSYRLLAVDFLPSRCFAQMEGRWNKALKIRLQRTTCRSRRNGIPAVADRDSKDDLTRHPHPLAARSTPCGISGGRSGAQRHLQRPDADDVCTRAARAPGVRSAACSRLACGFGGPPTSHCPQADPRGPGPILAAFGAGGRGGHVALGLRQALQGDDWLFAGRLRHSLEDAPRNETAAQRQRVCIRHRRVVGLPVRQRLQHGLQKGCRGIASSLQEPAYRRQPAVKRAG